MIPVGVIQARQVEEVFTRTAPVIQLNVSGRLIGTTHEHPFYVIGKGWVTAIALMPGDVLASSTDSQGTVEAIIETGEIAAVYNLRISEHHTYFIGDDDWEFSVWAHNAEYVVKPHNGKLTLFEKGSNTPVEWSPIPGQCGPRTFDTQKRPTTY